MFYLLCQCVDANQVWSVQQSIDWMTALAPYKPLWIEEPTSPDDILGHAAIAKVCFRRFNEFVFMNVVEFKLKAYIYIYIFFLECVYFMATYLIDKV